MTEEHPFAGFIRTLGKGKHGSRSMSENEAHRAMQMILAGEAEPIQLGAFLMLMRVKEETPEELAGFVRAAKESLALPADAPQVQLDWSSYAGKRRHLPWFLLSALLLAGSGFKVFMHGAPGRKDDRVYTPQVLEMLGVKESATLAEAAEALRSRNFAFVTLQNISPVLNDIMNLRDMLGLRSPVHTLARMINPFNAPASVQGIFHPGYRNIHQGAAVLLKQPHTAVFKGEGGEVERNPDGPCLVQSVHNGELQDEEWPAMFSGPRHLKDETMDPARLLSVWRGDSHDEYGEAAVIGTTAIALKTMGEADSIEAAEALAADMWKKRPVSWLSAA
jgi:anthranilate phosphoribosyltransferase